MFYITSLHAKFICKEILFLDFSKHCISHQGENMKRHLHEFHKGLSQHRIDITENDKAYENTQTLAASATMSGSSIAVTSFKAGREFATRTTYTCSLLSCSHHITRAYDQVTAYIASKPTQKIHSLFDVSSHNFN